MTNNFEFETHPVPDINLVPNYGTTTNFHDVEISTHNIYHSSPEKNTGPNYVSANITPRGTDHFSVKKAWKKTKKRASSTANSAGKGISNAKAPSTSGIGKSMNNTFGANSKIGKGVTTGWDKTSDFTKNNLGSNSAVGKFANSSWSGVSSSTFGKSVSSGWNTVSSGVSSALHSDIANGLDTFGGDLFGSAGKLTKSVADAASNGIGGAAEVWNYAIWAVFGIIIISLVIFALKRLGFGHWMYRKLFKSKIETEKKIEKNNENVSPETRDMEVKPPPPPKAPAPTTP